MFAHLYKYRLKILLGNKMLLFWTLAFPLIMGVFFKAAFGNLEKSYTYETITVGIVSNQKNSQSLFQTTLKQAEIEKKKLFNIKELSEENAKKELITNKISGYFLLKDQSVELIIGQTGTDQLFLKEFLQQFEQTTEMYSTIQELNPSVLSQNSIKSMSEQKNFITQKNTGANKIDITSFMFFTLLGMSSMFGFFWGIKNVDDEQADQSPNGIRLTLSPNKKLTIVLANWLSAFTLFFLEILFILLIYRYVLSVNFGERWNFILLTMIISSLTSISMGIFLGNMIKGNLNLKIVFGISFQMFCSFLSGMMSPDVTVFIKQNIPILGYLNPVNLVSDSLYKLYYYQNIQSYYVNIFCLLLFCLFFITCSIFIGRREQYVHL